MGDLAGNYCLLDTKTITIDKNYNPIAVEILGDPKYTTDKDLVLNLRLDSFDKDNYLIYISGQVLDTPDTHEWIPFKDTIAVTLDGSTGNKNIYYKILSEGIESQNVYDYVFLNPSLPAKSVQKSISSSSMIPSANITMVRS